MNEKKKGSQRRDSTLTTIEFWIFIYTHIHTHTAHELVKRPEEDNQVSFSITFFLLCLS